jgi:hypothetical protein
VTDATARRILQDALQAQNKAEELRQLKKLLGE